MPSRISPLGDSQLMTITEYLSATALVTLIVWAALALLPQESVTIQVRLME